MFSSSVSTSLEPPDQAISPDHLFPQSLGSLVSQGALQDEPSSSLVQDHASPSVLHHAGNAIKTFSPLIAAGGEMFPPLKVAVAAVLGILTVAQVSCRFSYALKTFPL